MGDLISKAALFNALCNAQDKGEIFAIINAAPTVDAVEVVRCKSCLHRDGDGWCDAFCYFVDNDDYYCADGVAKKKERAVK